MAQLIPHFRSKETIGNFQPLYLLGHSTPGGGGNYWSLEETSWKIEDLPDLAEVHLDAGSTLKVEWMRLQVNYHGYAGTAPGHAPADTIIAFDQTWYPGDFKAVHLNSDQRTPTPAQITDLPLRRKTHAVNGFGNIAVPPLTPELEPLIFFGDTTGTFDDGEILIGNIFYYEGSDGGQDVSIISTSAPPAPPPTPGFPEVGYWQLMRYRDRIHTSVWVFDPIAGDYGNGNRNGNYLRIALLALSAGQFYDPGTGVPTPNGFTETGSGGWATLSGGPDAGADWSYILTVSRVP